METYRSRGEKAMNPTLIRQRRAGSDSRPYLDLNYNPNSPQKRGSSPRRRTPSATAYRHPTRYEPGKDVINTRATSKMMLKKQNRTSMARTRDYGMEESRAYVYARAGESSASSSASSSSVSSSSGLSSSGSSPPASSSSASSAALSSSVVVSSVSSSSSSFASPSASSTPSASASASAPASAPASASASASTSSSSVLSSAVSSSSPSGASSSAAASSLVLPSSSFSAPTSSSTFSSSKRPTSSTTSSSFPFSSSRPVRSPARSTLPSTTTSSSSSAVTHPPSSSVIPSITLTGTKTYDGHHLVTSATETSTSSASPSGVLGTSVGTGSAFAHNASGIVGVSVGGFLALVLFVVLMFFGCRRYRNRHPYDPFGAKPIQRWRSPLGDEEDEIMVERAPSTLGYGSTSADHGAGVQTSHSSHATPSHSYHSGSMLISPPSQLMPTPPAAEYPHPPVPPSSYRTRKDSLRDLFGFGRLGRIKPPTPAYITPGYGLAGPSSLLNPPILPIMQPPVWPHPSPALTDDSSIHADGLLRPGLAVLLGPATHSTRSLRDHVDYSRPIVAGVQRLSVADDASVYSQKSHESASARAF